MLSLTGSFSLSHTHTRMLSLKLTQILSLSLSLSFLRQNVKQNVRLKRRGQVTLSRNALLKGMAQYSYIIVRARLDHLAFILKYYLPLRKPYRRGWWVSPVDLLVLANLDKLLFIMIILLTLPTKQATLTTRPTVLSLSPSVSDPCHM